MIERMLLGYSRRAEHDVSTSTAKVSNPPSPLSSPRGTTRTPHHSSPPSSLPPGKTSRGISRPPLPPHLSVSVSDPPHSSSSSWFPGCFLKRCSALEQGTLDWYPTVGV